MRMATALKARSVAPQILGTDLPLWVAKENDVTREMLAPLINAFPKVSHGSSSRALRLCPCAVPFSAGTP